MFVKLTKGNKTFSYLVYHLKIHISLQSQKQFTAQINIDAFFYCQAEQMIKVMKRSKKNPKGKERDWPTLFWPARKWRRKKRTRSLFSTALIGWTKKWKTGETKTIYWRQWYRYCLNILKLRSNDSNNSVGFSPLVERHYLKAF